MTRGLALIFMFGGLSLPAADLISLRESVSPSALHDLRTGSLRIAGSLKAGKPVPILIRVTNISGDSFVTRVSTNNGKFACVYPDDFAKAPPLRPGMVFIDATAFPDFDTSNSGHDQAEAAVIVHGGREALPDFPHAFTTDLMDREGRTDQKCSKWAADRFLINLYMHSQAAHMVNIGSRDFDLDRPADFAWFKNNIAQYDFERRDRDWSSPLKARPARNFWKSACNTWFNSTNDNPLDGNPGNPIPSNYRPYVFANDFTDWLILYWMRTQSAVPTDDNLLRRCREGTANLLAMQHKGADNFALKDVHGRQEGYTAGAFRYGMFTTGEFMTEGTGWFYCSEFNDYVSGGVFNARSTWGLGEALRHDPKGPLASELEDAIRLSLRFCLHDACKGGYARKTSHGNTYWKDPGEHAYLVLGMLAACEAAPEMTIPLSTTEPPARLKDLCISSLNALVDLEKPGHQWSPYPNADPMAISALARGAKLFADHPQSAHWREVAANVADAWMNAKVDPKERRSPTIHFGYRNSPGTMTLTYMNKEGRVQIFNYIAGHWIQALADLYATTGTPRYRDRAEALISYLCGDNPFHVRLLNELGAVYNWTDDTDGDGLEDKLKQDMYPEASAFTEIGILSLIKSLK